MSALERRLLRRHPLRWLRSWLLQWVIGGCVVALGVVSAHPVYDVLLLARLTPWLIAVAGLLIIGTTFAPRARRMHTAAGAVLVGVSVFRVLSFVSFTVTNSTGEWGPAEAVGSALALHWVVLAMVGMHWTRLAYRSGLSTMVAAAGRDDRVG